MLQKSSIMKQIQIIASLNTDNSVIIQINKYRINIL